MKALDWEYLTLKTKTVSLALKNKFFKKEIKIKENIFFRARVIVNGYLGEAYAYDVYSDKNELIMQATTNATRSKRKHLSFYQGKYTTDLFERKENSNPCFNSFKLYLQSEGFYLAKLYKSYQKIKLQSNSFSGLLQNYIDTFYLVGYREIKQLMLIDAKKYYENGDKIFSPLSFVRRGSTRKSRLIEMPWLISPTVLSKLLLNYWLVGLQSDQPFCEDLWFSKCCVYDPGLTGFDMEGTLKQELIFVNDRKIVNKPHDNQSALYYGLRSTGHCGFDNLEIDAVVVQPSNTIGILPNNHGIILIDAENCCSQVENCYCLTLLIADAQNEFVTRKLFVKLLSISALTSQINWVGDLQKGCRKWSSYWLIVLQPKKLFKFITV